MEPLVRFKINLQNQINVISRAKTLNKTSVNAKKKKLIKKNAIQPYFTNFYSIKNGEKERKSPA